MKLNSFCIAMNEMTFTMCMCCKGFVMQEN
jgi:hypothetical protein